MLRRRPPTLRQDADLGVLWLTAGRHELALSRTGVWVRAGARRADLPWVEIDQVQLGDVRGVRACVEVFTVAGRTYSMGPFPAPLAERWVRACADVAKREGVAARGLRDAVGLAIERPGD
jgi:hypothetical protein